MKPEEEREFVPVIPVVPVVSVIEEVNGLKCTICTKQLKSSQGLKYHITVCKGVLNPLECHFCHKVYSSSGNKCQHLKTCKVKKQQLTEEEKEALEEEEVLPIVKTKIPQILRQKVWNKWIGEEYGISKCWCCKEAKISQFNFDCGHVVSEYDGGKAILEKF